ncbi:MAG: aminoacyl-tRNA hydrolase [Kiritimatiellae bacterium]|nr:aminoacyl-tRNA hydrolase [Kiritimatiellia bacterium]MDD5522135.1 aminoacyl-tRNA hydrolase [Kiritimatiellia bacterium]
MKVIVGLGNPGKQYENTPHNAGFSVVDELAVRLECSFRRSFRFDARIAKTLYEEEDVLLVKPETYMNRSGLAVASILKYRRAEIGNMIVVLDDADLEQGQLRIRSNGSSGGHKGLGSIIEAVGGEEFTRVRIGIGREADNDLVEHVLKPYSGIDRRKMKEVFSLAADAVMCILVSDVSEAMNKFNGIKIKFENRD